jgi:hypothetical protein
VHRPHRFELRSPERRRACWLVTTCVGVDEPRCLLQRGPLRAQLRLERLYRPGKALPLRVRLGQLSLQRCMLRTARRERPPQLSLAPCSGVALGV